MSESKLCKSQNSRSPSRKRRGLGTIVVAFVLSATIGGVLAVIATKLDATDRFERQRGADEQLDWLFEAAYERAAIRVLSEPEIELDRWLVQLPDDEGREQTLVTATRFVKIEDAIVRIAIEITQNDAAKTPIAEKSYRISRSNQP